MADQVLGIMSKPKYRPAGPPPMIPIFMPLLYITKIRIRMLLDRDTACPGQISRGNSTSLGLPIQYACFARRKRDKVGCADHTGCQTCTVPSAPHEAIRLPSGDHTAS